MGLRSRALLLSITAFAPRVLSTFPVVKNDILAGFTLTWAGECSAWECDELNHMNMRHYVHKTDEARRGLVIRLGLSRAFRPGVVSTVRCRDFHIKYQGEARPGNPLRIDSAIIELGESTAQLCHIMTHRDGRIAATVVETIEHIYLPEDKVFPWPERVRQAATAFTVPLPIPAKARNVKADIPHVGMTLSDLQAAGAAIIGAGTFGVSEIDITDHVTMGSFFGRTTSSIAWFKDGWPEFEDPAYQDGGMSAALLEMRAVIHNYPKNGDAYAYLPALVGANHYTREFVHNLVDPVSGKSWVSMQASGCKFDLNTRKLVKTSEAELTELGLGMKPGVSA